MNVIEEKVAGLPKHFDIFVITGHICTKIIFQFYLYCYVVLVSSVSDNREMPSHPSHFLGGVKKSGVSYDVWCCKA
jgi:hypothetical protein